MINSAKALIGIISYPIIIALVLFGVPFGIYSFIASNRSTYFNQLEKGIGKKMIIEKLGNPDRVESCPEILYWDEVKIENIKECNEILEYGFIANTFYFGFDKSNRLISKYYETSE